ncbi:MULTISPECIES: hypothetical protein [Terrilactibacillus]|uniref:Uncharacterized protein n=2 Tax=Terrilactibacillus TaxID=1795633 RepID=A0A6N8CLY5_9BACI|nr:MULTISPECIES: hypothetical protein [Terrilactibacillus]MTT31012.1 hypothetical protein [Terrilactibacillus tamarindi]
MNEPRVEKKRWGIPAIGVGLIFTLGIVVWLISSNQGTIQPLFKGGHAKANPQTEEKVNTEQTYLKKYHVEDLRTFSLDQSIASPTSKLDFHITGDYVKETKHVVLLDVDNQHIAIKKSPSFKYELNGFRKKLNGYKVVAVIGGTKQDIKVLTPAPITLADLNGTYEQRKKGDTCIIGRLLYEDDSRITVEVPKGQITYDKKTNFKLDDNAQGKQLKEKMVRLVLDHQGAVKTLHYNWIDQE